MMRKLLLLITAFLHVFNFTFKKICSPGLNMLCLGMFFMFSFCFSQSAYITQRGSSTTGQSSTTSLVINKPTGVVSGDVMLVNIAQVGSNALSSPTLAGWNLISGSDLSTTGRWGGVLYKIATSSEPASYTFTLSSSVTGAIGSIIAFSGVDVSTGSPFDSSSFATPSTNTSNTVNASTLNTVTNNSAVIMLGQVSNAATTWSNWQTATSPGALNELYEDRKSTGAMVSVGAAWAIKTNVGSTGVGSATVTGGGQRNGGVLVVLKPYTFKSKIISINSGTATWCPGETRNVNVEIQNIGTATWTDGGSGIPDINIGVKWDTNGASWTDYHSRVDAGNLVPGATRIYTLPITASSNNGAGYLSPFAGGTTNKLTFDVVYEGQFWFASNLNGAGPGNTVLSSAIQTILAAPANKTVTAASSAICSGTATNINVAASEPGVNYQLRNASNINIGTPIAGTGGTIGLPTGNLTANTTFNVLASSCGNSVTMTGTATVTINPIPTTSNAGPDQNGNSSFTLAANTPVVGTGSWTIASGPSTSLSQFSNTSSATSKFTPFGMGTYILNWTISNGCGTSVDQVTVVANCVNNLIINGDFSNGQNNWIKATTKGNYVEVLTEGVYFNNGNNDNTAELDLEASLKQDVNVVPNVSYTLSFLYARRPGSPSSVAVDVKLTGGSSASVNYTTSDNNSAPFIGTLTFTPTGSSVGVEFYNSQGTTTLGSIIDNIVLIPTSQVSPMATTSPQGTFKTLTVCAGVPVQLDVDNVAAVGVSYAWSSTSPGAVFSSTTIKNPTITFTGTGNQNATVIVTNAGGCAGTPSTTYVNVKAAPAVYTVTGGGTYCSGGNGLAVGLASSAIGVNYQLQLSGLNNGGIIAGTGSPLNFGLKTVAGTYTVVATNVSTNCALNMSGNAVIIVNPLPTLTGASQSASVCVGSSAIINLSGLLANSTSTVTYTINGTAQTPVTSVVATVGGTASFATPVLTSANNGQTLQITGITTNGTPSCNQSFTRNLILSVNPLPSTPTVTKNNDINCGTLGRVTLTNLPSGTYKIHQTGQATQDITDTDVSRAITGLVAGNYYFTVENSNGCISGVVGPITIVGNTSSTTWNGSGWSNGLPDANKTVIISSVSPNQPFTGTPINIAACTLIITSAADVIIPSGFTFTVTNSVTSNGKLIFKNNSSLIQTTNAVNTGEIVYERETNISRYDLTYWSMPVTKAGFTMSSLSPNTLYDKYFHWDAVGSRWLVDPNGASLPMQIGNGYSIRGPQTYSITTPSLFTGIFTGVPNNGNISVPVEADKWNLMGNPYPSAVDAEELILITNKDVLGALYFWTHASPPVMLPGTNTYRYVSSDYIVFSGLGSTRLGMGSTSMTADAFNGNIAAGQAFFAKPTASVINFNNGLRRGSSDNTQFYKTAKTNGIEKNRIWLNLTNAEGAFKQTLLGYAQGATNSIDLSFDAVTMSANTYIDFYSISESKKLAIQARALPFNNTDLVPLGYKSTIAGEFTIAIDHTDGFFDTQEVYLEDKFTGIITDLRKENYTFKTAVGTSTTRFVLRYTNKTLGIDNPETLENSVLVSFKDQIVKITSSKEIIKEVNIYNVGGQLLYTKNNLNASELQITDLHSGDQVILVKVTLENGYSITKKVIFSSLK